MTKQSDIPKAYAPDWMERMDLRTRAAQIINARYHELTTDLGGTSHLSYQQRSLCKRAIHLEAMLEQWESALAKGEEVDSGKITNCLNSLLGVYRTLGLHRQTREVSLADVINRRQAE